MPLRGNKPLQEGQRLKVFVYGPAGVGKTLAALQFPDAYIIDTAKETSRYWKQIQKTNSEVFYCSDPYEVMEELKTLINEPHKFQTLVIDEATTLYQNIQKSWTDRFIAAQEERGKGNKASNLLEDFGFRYWDKVKRDWRRLLDLIRNLDMNVIVNAHQKDQYGSNQQIIGITSDSDKKDQHVFDFVFRLIIRGKEYKAITEKQRILPVELDPEARRFPKEFEWKYENLLKFYHKEYIEKPTKNSQLDKTKKEETSTKTKPKNETEKETKREVKKVTNTDDTPLPKEKKETQKEEEKNKALNNIDKIKELLQQEEISIKDFKKFLQTIVQWKHVNVLTKLNDKEQGILLNNWESKILPKFRETTNVEKEENKEDKKETKENKTDDKTEDKEECDPEKPITEKQKKKILSVLQKEEVSLERFFKGFMIKGWEEINQEGANNIIKNLKVMIGAL